MRLKQVKQKVNQSIEVIIKQHRKENTMNVTQQQTRTANTGKFLPGKRDELLAKLFMGGIMAVIVAIDVLALVCAK